MKKLIVLCLMLTGISAYAQQINQSKVPAGVKEAFKKNYAGAIAKWKLENGNFEANFKQNNKPMSVTFDPVGVIIETEMSIKLSEMPAKAQDYINTNYKGVKLNETTRIKKTIGVISYEAEVNGKNMIFDEQGNLTSATDVTSSEKKKNN